eukprot:s1318_g8.t1
MIPHEDLPCDDVELVDIRVCNLAGSTDFSVRLPVSKCGRDLLEAVCRRLPSKPGANIALQHGPKMLKMHRNLQEQGLGSLGAKGHDPQVTQVVTYVYTAVNLLETWMYLKEQPVDEEFTSLEGITELQGVESLELLRILPRSLQQLTLGSGFNESLEHVNLPNCLQSLTFGFDFNCTLEGIHFPSTLEHLTFGSTFNQSLVGIRFPVGLRSLTFGFDFNQSFQQVQFPTSLQDFRLGSDFNLTLEDVNWPTSLQNLTFGFAFNQSLKNVHLPSGLKSLTFGSHFNQSLECVENLGTDFNQSWMQIHLPPGLHHLTFGRHLETVEWLLLPKDLTSLTCRFATYPLPMKLPGRLKSLRLEGKFNEDLQELLPQDLEVLSLGDSFCQSLMHVAWPPKLTSLTLCRCRWPEAWPSKLEQLTLGGEFNQSLEDANFPPTLRRLTLGDRFIQSLQGIIFPTRLEELSIGSRFNQSFDHVQLPGELKSLTLGTSFNQSLEHTKMPPSLKRLSFGLDFNRSLKGVMFPESLETLTFGDRFNQSLEGVTFPSSLQQLSFGFDFNQSLERVTFPNSLESLTLGDSFNQSLRTTSLPATLQEFHCSRVKVGRAECEKSESRGLQLAGLGNAGNAVTQHLKWAIKFHRVRGVHVTPTVFVNGLEAGIVSSDWSADEWAAFLDWHVNKTTPALTP